MSPETLAKSGTESAHQIALFAWTSMAMNCGYPAADNMEAYTKKAVLDSIRQSPPGTPTHPCLKWFHAIPNGGARGDTKESAMIRGSQLKAEGVKPGVSDTLLPVFVYNTNQTWYCGLYLEMKKPIVGKESPEQSEFGAFVQSQGYCYKVAWGWVEAKELIKAYLAGSL